MNLANEGEVLGSTLNHAEQILQVMKSRPNFIIAVVWLISVATGLAQPPSNYNLKKVSIQLTDGKVIRGLILALGSDSIRMRVRSLSSINPWEVGNKVTFRLRGVPREYKGSIVGLTDSTVSVRLTTRPQDVSVVYRKQVESVKINEAHYQHSREQIPIMAFHKSQIRSIHLHRKGSGLLGGLVGFGAAAVGLSIAASNHVPEHFMDIYPDGVEPLLFLPFVGVFIGTIGKTHDINGDKQAYEAFAGRILKKGNKKRGDKPPL